jgi:hypothetical protein
MNGFCTTGIAASPRANNAPTPLQASAFDAMGGEPNRILYCFRVGGIRHNFKSRFRQISKAAQISSSSNRSRFQSVTLLAPAGIRVKGVPCGDNFI